MFKNLYLIIILILIFLIYNLIERKNKEKFELNLEIYPKKRIWLYWQNKNENSIMPEYLDLCYETIKKFCGKDFEINLLNDEKFKKISKTYDPKFENLYPLAKRSDYISFTLGYEFGGIYMDMDIICKENLINLFHKLKKYNFIGLQKKKLGDISIGFFLCRQNNIICKKLKNCFETYFKKYSNNEKINIHWSGCANEITEKLIKDLVLNSKYKYLGLDAKKMVIHIITHNQQIIIGR